MEFFFPRVRVERSKFNARLEALVAKYTGRVEGQVRVEATRDLPKCKTFSNNVVWESKSYSVHIGYSLFYIYSALDKAGMAKDLERYIVAINSEKKRLTKNTRIVKLDLEKSVYQF